MNVANLQLEGMMMALAALNNLLVHKGVLSIDEIDRALRTVEADITGDERLYEDMTPANRDAVCFPLRLLMMANQAQSETGVPGFSELAKMVGRTKGSYNDQM
ncbi:hypothetical protein [Kumtagia ephedrae]|jgi:hypothetical protein|uniref:Uncharacterized protein n=1 Tax=Kumtagia ephedrae TaxID=2116701 RepID=A0A2P7S8N4_9HYPH|nr:hypothetical protein [Mesorhizobium ephedrae]PSJ58791.1 hypothetical protein C7I84_15070 [Mesorhizobium ephedrae]